ncbi:DUF4371 domain-containing protein [Trichonephila clavipes]|nr:DUF4371 domain-containing protein [Trichonephila clavipes]
MRCPARVVMPSETNESDVGYIFEVDLEYSSDLHDKHSDFPLAPENRPPPNCKEPRLLTTLEPKTKYVLHYSNLKLYLKLGKLLKIEDYDLPSATELLKKKIFKDLGSDTAFNGMLCDARELADEIDIPANVELTKSCHTVRRRNVNFDYEARDDPIEDPTLKYKTEFIFSHYIKLSMHLNPGLI